MTNLERYRRQLDRLTRCGLEEALHPREIPPVFAGYELTAEQKQRVSRVAANIEPWDSLITYRERGQR